MLYFLRIVLIFYLLVAKENFEVDSGYAFLTELNKNCLQVFAELIRTQSTVPEDKHTIETSMLLGNANMANRSSF